MTERLTEIRSFIARTPTFQIEEGGTCQPANLVTTTFSNPSSTTTINTAQLKHSYSYL